MGNLQAGRVDAELGLLRNWTLVEIKTLFRVYWMEVASRSQTVSIQLFNYLISKSPISKSVRVFPYFTLPHTTHADMLLFFTCVTIYSLSSFPNKSKCNPQHSHLQVVRL